VKYDPCRFNKTLSGSILSPLLYHQYISIVLQQEIHDEIRRYRRMSISDSARSSAMNGILTGILTGIIYVVIIVAVYRP
jgi:hypothetical protein